MDGYLGRLLGGLEKLPHAEQVNIILLSDHGQAEYLENSRAFILDEYVNIGDAGISVGAHGWAPAAPAMHGFFVASGPNIKPGISLDSVNAVDIYPLMLSILGLDAPQQMDGDPSKLAGILYEPFDDG